MDINIIKECVKLSLEGSITFPEVVSKLAGAGVERYMVDFGRVMNHYYGVKGESSSMALDFKVSKIAEDFNVAEIKRAIADSQQGKIKYMVFLERAIKAGCCRYEVFITGRKVIYCGRNGDQHIELFPS